MATITNRSDRNVFAGRHLAAAGVVRPASRDAEIEQAYAEARRMLDEDRRITAERARIEARFHAAAGNWTDRMRALQAARDFDAAHPSRDPLYDELYADQMCGLQYPEAA